MSPIFAWMALSKWGGGGGGGRLNLKWALCLAGLFM